MQQSTGSASQRRWIHQQLVFGCTLELIDNIFNTGAIGYMPIKGAYLIAAGIAPQLPERKMLDIDILVRPGDFQKTIGLLSVQPHFTPDAPDPWFFERTFLLTDNRDRVFLELHHQINREERFRLPADELFSRGSKQTATRVLPSPEDALVILLCHTMVHIGKGLQSSTFIEMAAIMSQKGFSWNRFMATLRTTGIEPFGFALLRECSRKMRVPIRVPAKYRWADVLLKITPQRDRSGKMRQMLFRGFAEPLFARSPARLTAGWIVRTVKAKLK
jgi:hypothetical protein